MMVHRRSSLVLALVLFGFGLAQPAVRSQDAAERPAWATRDLRAGIIGTDTSHVPQLTKYFASRPEWRIKVVAAFKGGSPDLAVSANRVEGFAKTIATDHGVQIVESIDALVAMVDVVLLTSVDGRPHLLQVRPVFASKKPVFIDKPLAASLSDAREIVRLARETGTPFFSASSVRFHPDLARLRHDAGVGTVSQVEASYVLNKIDFHPDLFFYGIHGVEALYAVMGPGCVRLSRTIAADADITTCRWKDGRRGIYRGLPKADSSRPLLTVTGSGGTSSTTGAAGVEGLMRALAEFFHTGRPPVDPAESLEVIAFMAAADVSKARNGAEVALAELR
jgi:predicted dehydrogenase